MAARKEKKLERPLRVNADTRLQDYPEWVDMREAAACLDISVYLTRQLIHTGRLKAQTFGKRLIRISRESLLALKKGSHD